MPVHGKTKVDTSYSLGYSNKGRKRTLNCGYDTGLERDNLRAQIRLVVNETRLIFRFQMMNERLTCLLMAFAVALTFNAPSVV